MTETPRGDFFKTFRIVVTIVFLASTALLLYMLYGPAMSVISYFLRDPQAFLVDPLFMVLIFPGLTYAGLVAYLAIWGERKFAAKVQNRVGPLYAGALPGGILQNIADLVKILFKEVIIPRDSDKPIFILAPVFAFIVGSLPVVLVPYSPTYVILDFPVGLILFFVFTAFYPLVLLLAGWSSNNKFSFIGSLRALYQQASYEIPLFLSALAPVMLAGSLRLVDIGSAQGSVWFILVAPISAIVFFTSILAELEKYPFDIPEADSELVAGWLTEYSGVPYLLYQFGAYIKMVAYASLFTVLFLGGWAGFAFLAPEWWMVIKVAIVVTIVISTRAFFPRIRMDQLLSAGWTKLIPLALLSLASLVVLQMLGLLAFLR
ncbi:MAG TPA: NADH-quinone oxidoreductase subunit NuoH [Conexivisphaerales archaeon]|nr:NADH-quinone oxidoreductase subunit NuoH [Conexivisphaerales archaeon]